MSNEFYDDLGQILDEPTTRSFIVTLGKDENPHVEEGFLVQTQGSGQILLPDLGEYSRTNLNLVRSLWFNRKAVLYVLGAQRRFEVLLEPYKVHVSGPLFESYYRQSLKAGDGRIVLAVWILDVVSITEETPHVRDERENLGRIPLVHLDQIAVARSGA